MTSRHGSFSLVLLAVLAVLGTSCRQERRAATQMAARDTASVRTVSIPVDGMICQVCAGSVKSALKKVDGVSDAEISLEKRSAVVHYDERHVSLEALTVAIKNAGFKPGAPTVSQSQ